MMIRLAEEKDLLPLMKQLSEDSSRAMFIYGDIEQNGLHTDYQTVWIDEDEDRMNAVYLRYYANFVYYLFNNDFDKTGLLELLNSPDINTIGCCKSHQLPIEKELNEICEIREMFFCECREWDRLLSETPDVEMGTVDDAEEIAKSFSEISEFQNEVLTLDERILRIKNKIVENKTTIFVVKKDGRVVANASTAVETGVAVMVASVFSLPFYRNLGYAKQVVSALTHHALQQGKTPCLFYDNPSAGRIYHGLGYVTFDTWCMGKITR